MTWQESARKLPFGHKRKVPHCTQDASMYISNDTAGVRYYCFRCQENGFETHGRLSAADVLRMRRQEDEELKKPYHEVIELYHGDCPPEARVWTLKAGIRPEVATDILGYGWSPKLQRVVVPILHSGEPTGEWIARAVDGRSPKYIFQKGAQDAVWYNLKGTGPVVVVEDSLSAGKLSLIGVKSCAVLGTTITQSQALLLAEHVLIGWFDNDDAGTRGYIKLRKAMAPYGVEPKRIQTERDPKLYNAEEINRYIKEAA